MKSKDNQIGVIFDLDGVLIDTAKFHKQSWYDLAKQYGFEVTNEFFYRTFGMQNYQIIPMLVGKELSTDEIDKMGDWKERRYRELIAGKLTMMDGVEGLIIDLKGNGFALAIGSSTTRVNLDFTLEHIAVGEYFDAYVTGEDVNNGKPAPDTFLKAAERLALAPSRCVVVEDAIPGVEAGKNAGMAVVAVTSTRKRDELGLADIIVDSLAELNADDFKNLLYS
jgi:beta-phosphoglucomutase